MNETRKSIKKSKMTLATRGAAVRRRRSQIRFRGKTEVDRQGEPVTRSQMTVATEYGAREGRI
jgi:hypothetical protein